MAGGWARAMRSRGRPLSRRRRRPSLSRRGSRVAFIRRVHTSCAEVEPMAVLEPITAIEVDGREIDPVTVSTIWFSLQRTCREMRHLLYRTGQSFTITQSKDVSTGIWDANG